jgi:hypothetical protein
MLYLLHGRQSLTLKDFNIIISRSKKIKQNNATTAMSFTAFLTLLVSILMVSLFAIVLLRFQTPYRSRTSKNEYIACRVLEEIYNEPFNKVRPDFLKNPSTKRNLELDCYNEDLRIALEYQGPQHYQWPNFTRQSYEDFEKQRVRDKFKERRCKEEGIKLIKVPYTVKGKDRIREYILSEIKDESG